MTCLIESPREAAPAALAIVGIATLVLLASPPRAATAASESRASRAAHPSPASAPPRAGMVVGIDPASGEIGPPTSEQLEALRPLSDSGLNRSSVGLEKITRADGSQHVDLRGRFRTFSVVSIGTDGALRMTCVDDPASARRWVGAAAGQATPPRAPFGPQEE